MELKNGPLEDEIPDLETIIFRFQPLGISGSENQPAVLVGNIPSFERKTLNLFSGTKKPESDHEFNEG